jgi:hypothetical protein
VATSYPTAAIKKKEKLPDVEP